MSAFARELPGSFVQAINVVRDVLPLSLMMARRDLSARHGGGLLGAGWALGHPLFLMALYVTIFAFVFKQKIGGTQELPLDYTSYILCGLVPWLTFQASMSTACSAIRGNAGLVKQFTFRLEILPLKDVLTALPVWFVGISVLLLYQRLTVDSLHWTWILLPVLFLLQVGAMIGVAWLLSAIVVFVRDVKELVTMFCTAGIFLMPVLYLPAWTPALFRPLLYFNPFSYLIWCYQDILYYGRIEHPFAWLLLGVGAPVIFTIGYWVFQRIKPHFSSAL